MKLNPHKEELLTMNVFLAFLAILLLVSSILFETVVLNEQFNILPIVATTILISLFPLIKGSVVKKEVYKLIFVAGIATLLGNINSITPWIEVSMYNFYSIMYVLFFYCYLSSINITNKFLQGYIYIINFFLFFYFLLQNVEVIVNNFFFDALYIYVVYITLGIKLIVLFVSLLTFISLVLERLSLTKEQNIEIVNSNFNNEITSEPEISSNQAMKKDIIIAQRISLFFESDNAYLDIGFTLNHLCEALSINNPQIVSRVINKNLDTTFYKLVAKYRINYALTLLQSQENWTLDAISNSCGFKSINTFKKYFMDYVGSSPCVYRTNSI